MGAYASCFDWVPLFLSATSVWHRMPPRFAMRYFGVDALPRMPDSPTVQGSGKSPNTRLRSTSSSRNVSIDSPIMSKYTMSSIEESVGPSKRPVSLEFFKPGGVFQNDVSAIVPNNPIVGLSKIGVSHWVGLDGVVPFADLVAPEETMDLDNGWYLAFEADDAVVALALRIGGPAPRDTVDRFGSAWISRVYVYAIDLWPSQGVRW
ncbi:hypothetical protein PSPO01_07431 [Paraphaeosphaeria sporulosa]